MTPRPPVSGEPPYRYPDCCDQCVERDRLTVSGEPSTALSALSQALGVRQTFRRFMEDEGGPLPDHEDEAAGMLAVLRELGYELSEARATPPALPPEAIEWAQELVRQGYRDEHIATFTADGYGLEHQIRCRPNLTGCIFNEWLRTQVAPDREPGRYVMEWTDGGPIYMEVDDD